MKWNRCKWQPGGSSCTDLFDLEHRVISFHGTRNAVAMNRMSVERRRFLRGVPGPAMDLPPRETRRFWPGIVCLLLLVPLFHRRSNQDPDRLVARCIRRPAAVRLDTVAGRVPRMGENIR